MSVADWIIIAFLIVSVVGAAIRGFFQEALKLVGWAVAYLLAAWEYRRAAEWLAPYLKSPYIGEIAGFLIIFFAVLVLAALAGRLAHWLMKKAGLSTIDRIFGAVLGLLRGALVVAIVLTALTAFTPAAKWLNESQLAPYFLVGGRAAIWLAPSELRQRFYQGLDYVRRAPSAFDASHPKPATPSK
jgi:membrane protein required for colicin V production